MPLANNFKPFAVAGGSNVISQAAYEALAELATGFVAGTAQSDEVNKVLRQGAFGTAVLMQYTAETLNTDSLDNGDLAAHVIRLRNALSAGATNPAGAAAVRGGLVFNNAGAPTTKVDIDADLALLTDATGKLTRVIPGAPITLDMGVAGPAANGRDQAGAFGNSNWIYNYLIYKPSTATLATLASLTPPEAFDGTTLPALYTSWGYVAPVYKDGAGNLVDHRLQGALFSYEARQAALVNGTQTIEQVVSVAGLVPPNAPSFLLDALASNSAAGAAATRVARLRWKTLKDFRVFDLSASSISDWQAPAGLELPNAGQQFLYRWDGAAAGRRLDAWVTGFRVANGG